MMLTSKEKHKKITLFLNQYEYEKKEFEDLMPSVT